MSNCINRECPWHGERYTFHCGDLLGNPLKCDQYLMGEQAPMSSLSSDGLGRQFLTADNKVISLGMKIYVRDPDKFEFEDDYILEQTVEAMYLEKGFSEYKGDITIGGEDWEGGNLDCYAAKDNVSA